MVRKLLLLTGVACMILCLVIAQGQPAFAKGTDGFELSVAEAGDKIAVTVTLNEAKDVYAYDLVVKFDPVRLAYTGTNISLKGFTVKPLLSHGELRLAHTSIGAVAGRNGKIELAVVEFKRIRGGDAIVKLESANLVDSKIAMRELAPNESVVTAKSGEAVIIPADLAGHWSEDAVREAMELGFVTGFGDGTFRPDTPVTRQEATVLLAKALLLQGGDDPALSFADAEAIPLWAQPYVATAVRAQWINGYDDGTFRGGKPIARQEFAAIAARSIGTSAAAPAAASGAGPEAVLSNFADRHLLAPWAVGPTALAVERGIMRGQGQASRLLNPQAATTRAEAVTMILRLLYADNV